MSLIVFFFERYYFRLTEIFRYLKVEDFPVYFFIYLRLKKFYLVKIFISCFGEYLCRKVQFFIYPKIDICIVVFVNRIRLNIQMNLSKILRLFSFLLDQRYIELNFQNFNLCKSDYR